MKKCKLLYFSFFLFAICITYATAGCQGVSSTGPFSTACATAMQEIVTLGYPSSGYNGPPGNNDCTRWGRYWINCNGLPTGPCLCPAVVVPVGSCGPFADTIIANCGSCGGGVYAANQGSGGNPAIRHWGALMSASISGVCII